MLEIIAYDLSLTINLWWDRKDLFEVNLHIRNEFGVARCKGTFPT